MDLYERNYIYLRRLVPQLADIHTEAVSCISGHLDLHLSILEKCKFTTTLKLSYHFFEASERRSLEPDLHIRIYHDARLAETQTGILHTIFVNEVSAVQRKWYLNRFLYKWLSYCLFQGHCLLLTRTTIKST